MTDFSWTIFFILFAAGLFGSITILPYSLAINPQAMEQIKAQAAAGGKKVSPVVMMLASVLQSTLLVAVASFVGLLATRAVGLRLPVLEAIVSGQPVGQVFLSFLPAALLVGLLAGILLVSMERFVFQPRMPKQLRETDQKVTFWKRALACFYGGVVEEILLRLFVMAGLAWLLGLIWHTEAGTPALGAFWLANLISTLLFGAGHLPATKAILPLTPLVITRALVLNGMAGLAFGFLFINYGLEAGIVAHFALDIVIHILVPMLPTVKARNEVVPQAA